MFTIGQLITPTAAQADRVPIWNDQIEDLKYDAQPGQTFVYDGEKSYPGRRSRYYTVRRLVDGRRFLTTDPGDIPRRFAAL